MARYVDDIIDTSTNPVVTLVITTSSVTREVVALVHIQVGIHVTLVCSPDSACHTRPRLLNGKNTFDIIAVELFTGYRVDDGELDTEEGKGSTTRLGRSDTSKRCDDVRSCLSLPVCL